MTKILSEVAVVLVIFSAAACGELFGPSAGLLVESDKQRYDSDEAILVTLRNTGETELVFPRCVDRVATTVEVRAAAGWEVQHLYAHACPAIYSMVPLSLAPAEDYEHTLPGDGASDSFLSEAFAVSS